MTNFPRLKDGNPSENGCGFARPESPVELSAPFPERVGEGSKCSTGSGRGGETMASSLFDLGIGLSSKDLVAGVPTIDASPWGAGEDEKGEDDKGCRSYRSAGGKLRLDLPGSIVIASFSRWHIALREQDT